MKKLTLSTARLAVLMAVLTAVSKLLGFVREMVLANYFGAGPVTDAYIMAQSIPNNLMAAVISAVGTSYLPAFSAKNEKEGREAADRFTSQLVDLQLLIIAAVVALGCLLARPLISVFAPGFSGETADLTAWYLRFAFFVLFFSVLTYIFGAWLNYKGVFLPQIVYAVAANLVLITVVVISASTDRRLLIIGPLASAALTGTAHFIRAKKEGFRYTPDFSLSEGVKEVIGLAVPIFIGGYVSQINLAIDKILASGLAEGCVSALNYANQIIGSISGLTVTIFVTILYPRLNMAYVQGDHERMSDLSERGIRLIWILAVPLSFGLICYAPDVIRLLFERGAFSAAATKLTSSALVFYSIGLAFLSLNTLITKIYYSMHDTKTAVKCSAVSVLLNIVLNLALVGPMGHAGLALATSISYMANTALLGYTFTRRYPSIRLLSSFKAPLQILAVSAVSVGCSRLVYSAAGTGIVRLALCCALAVVLYLAMLKILHFQELDLIYQLFGRGRKSGDAPSGGEGSREE